VSNIESDDDDSAEGSSAVAVVVASSGGGAAADDDIMIAGCSCDVILQATNPRDILLVYLSHQTNASLLNLQLIIISVSNSLLNTLDGWMKIDCVDRGIR
jgi:hypothetical protein